MSLRRRFHKKARPKEEMSLQITSMADIFTIILVFLLKSFSTGITSITANNVNLPEVKTAEQAVESLKVEVGKDAILIDGKVVTHLTDFKLDATDVERDQTPRSLNTALVAEMKKQVKDRAPAAANAAPAENTSPETLLVLADENAPYALLKTVLASATNAGFSDFRLIVVEDQ